jgi:hypothetical protein
MYIAGETQERGGAAASVCVCVCVCVCVSSSSRGGGRRCVCVRAGGHESGMSGEAFQCIRLISA